MSVWYNPKMSIEREIANSGRMPADVFEQLSNLPDPETQEKICENIYNKVCAILNSHGVVFYEEISSCRVKSKERIEEKIKIRGSTLPVRDIYGTRMIVGEVDRYRVSNMIKDGFPLTPDVFTDGRPSAREYADPAVRDFISKNFNPHISSFYSALHINVVFHRMGADLYDIGEVQIMTKEELMASHISRDSYVSKRNGS